MTEKERIMNTNIIPIKVECEICEVIDSLLAFQHLDEYFEKLKKENIAHNDFYADFHELRNKKQ